MAKNNQVDVELKVDISKIQEAQRTLQGVALKTDLSYSKNISQILGVDIFLKFENTQRTGSFKIRGACNRISRLSAEERQRGVIASSAGNHAQGVALSASLAQVPSTIVMPLTASLTKVNATKGYGAKVIQFGEFYDQAFEHAKELAQREGLTFVHPYQDSDVIAGQGTVGLEIMEQLPDVESLIVPIGGGGLISGIACAAKTINPKIKIIGVQSSVFSPVYHAFKEGFDKFNSVQSGQKNSSESGLGAMAGRRVATIADGIAVKTPSRPIFDHFISKYVDDIVTVNDDEIAEAIVFFLERVKTVVEGSGAVTLAALFNHALPLGRKTCLVLSGGNIDLNIVAKVIEKGQIKRGRLIELSVIVDDVPGVLSKLTKAIGDQRANILEVRHDRITQGLFLRETRIDFVLETISHEHIQRIREALFQVGARVV